MKKSLIAGGCLLAAALMAADNRFIDLSSIANRNFADPAAHDGDAGWLDEGPGNDLSALPQGELAAGKIKFNVTKKAVALYGAQRKDADPVRKIVLPKGTQAQTLYLLQATENGFHREAGKIHVTYADGSKEVLPVTTPIECGDWRNAGEDLKEDGSAQIVWRQVDRPLVGLYAGAYKLRRQDPVQIILEVTAHKAVWFVAAMTLRNDAEPIPAEGKHVIRAGKDFFPVTYCWNTLPGSPLDFSNLNDAPAGKYGRVMTKNGHFVFEQKPDAPVRFYGTNVVFDCAYVEKELAIRIADELARTGCNLVRIHLNDNLLIPKKAKTSLEIDPEMLDRLEFFISELKKRGIYTCYDFSGFRCFRPGDPPELACEPDPMTIKALILVEPKAMENLKVFTKKLFTHKNPYTGMSLAEDSSVAFVDLLNEDGVEFNLHRSPRVRAKMVELFQQECGGKAAEDHRKSNSPFTSFAAFSGTEKEARPTPEFVAYLRKRQQKVHRELIRFTREELKIPTPVTSLNNEFRAGSIPQRAEFDYVDNHMYHSHPQYSKYYRLPWRFARRASIDYYAGSLAWVMPSRIYGKPYTITEYNYCHPNAFRCEGAVLLPAYALLNDYDALVHYRWSSDMGRKEILGNHHIRSFSGNCDPLAMAENRLIAYVFRLGLVKPAKEKYAVPVPDSIEGAVKFNAYAHDIYRNIGLIAQAGSATPSMKLNLPSPIGIKNPKIARLVKQLQQKGIAESATGEIRLDVNGRTLTVNAPRVVMATLPGGRYQVGGVTFETDLFQTVALVPMDGQTVKASRKLLLYHLTDVTNSNITFSDGRRTCMTAHGDLPLLMRRGKCRITIPGTQSYTVTALKLDGSPAGTVKGELGKKGFVFTADAADFGGTFFYQLTK